MKTARQWRWEFHNHWLHWEAGGVAPDSDLKLDMLVSIQRDAFAAGVQACVERVERARNAPLGISCQTHECLAGLIRELGQLQFPKPAAAEPDFHDGPETDEPVTAEPPDLEAEAAEEAAAEGVDNGEPGQ